MNRAPKKRWDEFIPNIRSLDLGTYEYMSAPSKGCQINPKGWLIDGTLWKVQVYTYIYILYHFLPNSATYSHRHFDTKKNQMRSHPWSVLPNLEDELPGIWIRGDRMGPPFISHTFRPCKELVPQPRSFVETFGTTNLWLWTTYIQIRPGSPSSKGLGSRDPTDLFPVSN